MNKWVKRIYLVVAIGLGVILLPVAVLSAGTMVPTIYLGLFLISFFVLKKGIHTWLRCAGIIAVIVGYCYCQTFVVNEISGRVVDKTTKRPIENAIVHVEYIQVESNIAGGSPVQLGEALAVTDRDGCYRIGRKIMFNFFCGCICNVHIKVLHPLWEAKETWIRKYGNDKSVFHIKNVGNFEWMINKFPPPIRYDEELWSLGEKYRDNKEFNHRDDMEDDYFSYARKCGILNNIQRS